MLLLAAFAFLPTPITAQAVVKHFLTVCHAQAIGSGNYHPISPVDRQMSEFQSELPISKLQTALSRLSETGWKSTSDGKVPSTQTFEWRNIQIAIRANSGETAEIAVTKLQPKQLQILAKSRLQMAMDTESVDGDFHIFEGEGFENEIMFPAGRSDYMYFVYGESYTYRNGKKYLRPGALHIAAYERSGNTIQLKWKVELVEGKEKSNGTLGQYLRNRNLTLKYPNPTVQTDLDSPVLLSYHSENSGPGGAELGYIDESGRLQVAHQVETDTWQVTVPEERWLKQNGPPIPPR